MVSLVQAEIVFSQSLLKACKAVLKSDWFWCLSVQIITATKPEGIFLAKMAKLQEIQVCDIFSVDHIPAVSAQHSAVILK